MSTLQESFAAVADAVRASLVERDDEVDLLMTALVAQESVLLVGPPGVAKSLLLDSIMAAIGGKTFSILLTRYTTPAHVFGAPSIKGLLDDKPALVTTNRLPEADAAFVDEVFRASPAILTTLLKVMNERTFDFGDGVERKIPLRLLVGGTNSCPQHMEDGGVELNAFWDRFLVRKFVDDVKSADGNDRLYWDASVGVVAPGTPKLTLADLDEACRAARAVTWPDATKEVFVAIVDKLAAEGVQPGARRRRKAVGLCRAAAWLAGSQHVLPEHLEVLKHVLWEHPDEQPAKTAEIVAKLANPAGERVNQLIAEARAIIDKADTRDLASVVEGTKRLKIVKAALAEFTTARAKKAGLFVEKNLKDFHRATLSFTE